MRYRLMATYRGVPYEAGVGPSTGDVVLFAACPPPEELGFEPATGHWRKQVIWAEIDALWESRPVGTFGGEPCIVLDDLGDRLHITYRGTDTGRAAQLGYWQVDRGVFEMLVPREAVTGLTEERVDVPLHRRATPATPPAVAYPYGPSPWQPPAPPATPPETLAQPPAPPAVPPEALAQPAAPPAVPPERAAARGRSGRRQRVTAREIFCELADLAGIPRGAYTLEAEADGTMCLLAAAGGFEVFLAADGARLEARSFADEEAAYFYLFGVLAAEAIRGGALRAAEAATTAPAGPAPPSQPSRLPISRANWPRGRDLAAKVHLAGGADGPPLPKQPRRH